MVPCSFAVHAHIYTKKTEIVIAPIGSAIQHAPGPSAAANKAARPQVFEMTSFL